MRQIMSPILRSLPLIPLAALLISAPVTAAPNGEFGWPLSPRPAVVRAFDKPDRDWLPGHRGVDLAGRPGQTVHAAGDGTVVFAGKVAGKPVVSIDHAGGLRTTYEPVTASVALGHRVIRGSPIGMLEPGHAECAAAACLHWGARRGHDYLDPLGLLHRAPIRLKPLAPAGASQP
ncbi:M23 family metallopeptidase [Nocardia huaxiensis]|uniref:M23 family metallopeptidase n=1 Tax=Nocardia huaxiensis TaxID=2755382 RepID=A0A7D6ZKQ3_9NOCA|nr:M23 family metallopeptidase [Nocardia huaxiensis]QLY29843.1 M23 family metallopeptidase [Nocardia huaxiensis]